jgi:hypothetical protein
MANATWDIAQLERHLPDGTLVLMVQSTPHTGLHPGRRR